MKEDGLASSLVMRERGGGPGMRIHSSSKRTPRASTLSATVMDKEGWGCVDIGIESCGRRRPYPHVSTRPGPDRSPTVCGGGGGVPGPRQHQSRFPEWLPLNVFNKSRTIFPTITLVAS